MPATIIEITGLTKEYDGHRAVDNLNLEIKKGEVFGLLGPNGAGKTTTILMMLGLTEPTSGKVMIKGFNATTEPIKVKRITGYLPDQVGFYDYRTGLENLVYTAQLNGIPEEAAYQAAEKLLQQVGLDKAKNDKVRTYSKGMKQRLGLADVLIKEPEIIILDEPTIGIDPKGINEFLSMIRNLSKEKGITVLLSSHLLQQVQKICDRVGIFVDGKLLAQGNIKELANKLFAKQENIIEAQVEGLNETIIGELKEMEGVQEVTVNGNRLTITCKKNLTGEIARRIVTNGASLLELSSREYGLDEIYQHYFEGRAANDS